jgi:hypothetical protein
MHLRHGFELAQIACRESRIYEYPRASVGAMATWLAHRTIPFFCRQNGIATTRVFGKTPVPLGFFTLDDILLGREHEELFHSFSSDLAQCARLGSAVHGRVGD